MVKVINWIDKNADIRMLRFMFALSWYNRKIIMGFLN
ncbi:Uncharacterised protein [Providencia rettgeri]|uniref:Uncharacterized protein n=1 Tax=Providencia rettgeri TaxID=587 RepID=A0A379FW77_PRORE|nr:Uncharacterised protein [Providencia rettgeri]